MSEWQTRTLPQPRAIKNPRTWPLKWRYRALDLHAEGLDPWRIRAIVEIEAKRRLPRITLYKWIRSEA